MPRTAVAALLLLVCVSYSLVSLPPETANAQGHGGDLEKLKPYLHYLAEFSQRRRANIYFPNEQSIFYGAQVNFVDVGRGNLTFARRDLVTVGRMPLAACRWSQPGSMTRLAGEAWSLGRDGIFRRRSILT